MQQQPDPPFNDAVTAAFAHQVAVFFHQLRVERVPDEHAASITRGWVVGMLETGRRAMAARDDEDKET